MSREEGATLSREVAHGSSAVQGSNAPDAESLGPASMLETAPTRAVTMDVLIDRESIPIDMAVFDALFENSHASTYAAFRDAKATSSIKYATLVELARKGQIPHPLFFAPLEVALAQAEDKRKKLIDGVGKGTFSINSRGRVELSAIDLIVLDLLRKQELVKKFDKDLAANPIVGLLRGSRGSPEIDAETLMSHLGVTHDALANAKSKERAFDYLVSRLEANDILVSRAANNFMPQQLQKVNFSGITVKDKKVPYIFLTAGEGSDKAEPAGRRIFTTVLLAVLVARGKFAPVTMNTSSLLTKAPREYDITAAVLMPRTALEDHDLRSLDAVRVVADKLKVTPSAVTVRATRLGLIDVTLGQQHLDQLRHEFESQSRVPRGQLKVENALHRYNGRELSSRMLSALDTGQISQGDFLRVVCQNRLQPAQIPLFRAAVA